MQNIENLWMRAKCKLRRQFGTTGALFDTYLEEFMWQERNKDHRQRLAGCNIFKISLNHSSCFSAVYNILKLHSIIEHASLP